MRQGSWLSSHSPTSAPSGATKRVLMTSSSETAGSGPVSRRDVCVIFDMLSNALPEAADGADLPTSGRFTFDVRDQAVGAAVQAGANLVDSDVAIRATRITRVAQSQVAGNALQLWGAVRSVRVRWLSATDVAGRGVEERELEVAHRRLRPQLEPVIGERAHRGEAARDAAARPRGPRCPRVPPRPAARRRSPAAPG